MISQGKVDRRTLPKPRKTERLQKMIEMAALGMTLRDIGQEFGITRERVRQILQREQLENGNVQMPHAARFARWVSLSDLSRAVGGKSRLTKLMAAGRVNVVQIGSSQYVERSEFETLKAEREATRPRCSVCQRITKNLRAKVPMCGACYRTEHGNRVRNNDSKYRRTNQIVVHRNSIHERIAAQLQRGGECTLSCSEATQASGLSPMQLSYARQAKLISTKPTNRCNNAGQFVSLYSGFEMQQIAVMLREMEQESNQ